MSTPEHQSLFIDHVEQIQTGQQEPSFDELAVQRQFEPHVNFTPISYEGLSEGRQSRVSVLEYELHGEQHQVLWKRMAAGKGLTEDEANQLADRLHPYRQSLQSTGWEVPQIYYSQVVRINNEAQIFSYEELIRGGDGEKMVRNQEQPNFKKWHLLGEVSRTLAGYPPASLQRKIVADREVTRLPHGLDLELANVVLDETTGALKFVDLFGPKELDSDGNWLTYSSKLDGLAPEQLKAVCATREGALLRFYRLAEKHWSESGADIELIRTEFLKSLLTTGLPETERLFVYNEVINDYPWLDGLYAEKQI